MLARIVQRRLSYRVHADMPRAEDHCLVEEYVEPSKIQECLLEWMKVETPDP